MPWMTATIQRLPDLLNKTPKKRPITKIDANIGTATELRDEK
jgi:hypothetical protein